MVRPAMIAVAAALLAACGGGDGEMVAAGARPATDWPDSGSASASAGTAATGPTAAESAVASEAQPSTAVAPAGSVAADVPATGVPDEKVLPQPATPVSPQAPRDPSTYIGPMTPDLQATIDAAVADAARRTGLTASQLVVVSAEAVIWADGSLGCPAPGADYTMALVPGHRVRIRAGGEVLDYHAGSRQLILCPAGRAVDPLPQESS